MAKIRAFKGFLYNPKKIKNMSLVVAPPYDVINHKQQDELYRKDQNNVVRLILNKDVKENDSDKNKYDKVRAILDKWINENVLVQDENDCIYVCLEDYRLEDGSRKQRCGFFCRVKLEEFSNKKVLPHENIIDVHMRDRLNLITKVGANLSPVFSVYSDENGVLDKVIRNTIKSKKPCFSLEFNGVKNRLWKISDKSVVSKLCSGLLSKKLFIADGHHRYQAALLHKNYMDKINGKGAYDSVLMYLVSSDDPGLSILATHRILANLPNCSEEFVLRNISGLFEIKKVKNKTELFRLMNNAKKNAVVFGLYTQKKNFYFLKLGQKVGSKVSKDVLDVEVLHNIILGDLLNWKDKLVYDKTIWYSSNSDVALKIASTGRKKMVFFLNPTRMDQVKRIANKGERMPQKSTFFYPKVLTGLVINKF